MDKLEVLRQEYIDLATKYSKVCKELEILRKEYAKLSTRHENFATNHYCMVETVENHCNCCNKFKDCSFSKDNDIPYNCAFFYYCPKNT